MSEEDDGERPTVRSSAALAELDPEVEPEALAEGARIGRYFLLSRLGEGGMGVVHLGYDPELHRRVAIKVLRSTADPAGRERMVREARALAQVSHPNLVHVYEVGTWGEHVFLAMEYVRGRSLAERVREGRVPWREAVPLMVRAGQGLLAAHKAGLVHRDFKPSNVLLGEDGTVRVADFGLARLEADAPVHDSTDLGPSKAEARRRALARTFSTEGSVLGTPAYMAPEQHAGGTLDARSDLYSFCVTLYELLAGKRPFGGTRSEIVKAKLAAAPSLPGDVAAPAWLRRVITRGLAPNADDRYPGMAELLDDLQGSRGRASRRMGLVGLVAGAGLLAWIGAGLREPAADCEPPQLAWAKRRVEVARAFEAVPVPHAEASLTLVTRHLDAHADAWSTTWREACEATHADGRQSEEMLALRMECLDRVRADFAALLEVLVAADAGVVERSILSAAGLADVGECSDLEALRTALPLPDDPDRRAAIAELRRELVRATAVVTAGKRSEATAMLAPLLQRARDVAYAPVTGEVLVQLALARAAAPSESEALLREAILEAASGKSDRLAARAWIKLVQVVGADEGRYDAAEALITAARAAVVRVGDDAGLAADLEGALGRVESARGRYDSAIEHYRRAEARVIESLGADDPRLRTILTNHGAVLILAGRTEAAREQLQHALDHGVRTLGPDHPYVAEYHSKLAIVLSDLGRNDDAREHYGRALAILDREPSRNARQIATARTNLAVAHLRSGATAEARAQALEALPVLQDATGPAAAAAGAPIDVIGLAASAEGDWDAAASAFQRAMTLLAGTVGAEHPSHAEVSLHLAQIRLDQARVDEARALATEAARILAASVGEAHPATTLAAAVSAEAALARGHTEGVEPALRALISEGGARDRGQRARASAALARLFADDPDRADEAAQLRQQAIDDFRAVGDARRADALATGREASAQSPRLHGVAGARGLD